VPSGWAGLGPGVYKISPRVLGLSFWCPTLMHERRCPPRHVRQMRLPESVRRQTLGVRLWQQWLPDPDARRRWFLGLESRRRFPDLEERLWRLLDPEGKRRRPRGAKTSERRRHSRGGRASGDSASEASERWLRTPRPERRRHTITHERRWCPQCASSNDDARWARIERRPRKAQIIVFRGVTIYLYYPSWWPI
jgi:hypothetical protein